MVWAEMPLQGSTGESSLVRTLRALTGPTRAAVKSFSCGSLEDGSDGGPGGPREHKPMARADNLCGPGTAQAVQRSLRPGFSVSSLLADGYQHRG